MAGEVTGLAQVRRVKVGGCRLGVLRTVCVLLTILFAMAAAGCRKSSRAAPPVIPATGESEVGLASWYGHPYHGRASASGEIYDMEAMTAAHRTLSFGTWVRVVNMENNRTATVRITDRGPFIEGRIIDLSRKAAGEIGMLGSGTALVRLEIIEGPEVARNPPQYSVQVGAFLVPENAQRLQEYLAEKFSDVFVDTKEMGDGLYYRVRVGRHSTMEAAQAVAARLQRQEEVTTAMVVRLN